MPITSTTTNAADAKDSKGSLAEKKTQHVGLLCFATYYGNINSVLDQTIQEPIDIKATINEKLTEDGGNKVLAEFVGSTALHIAVARNKQVAVNYLLTNEADVRLVDKQGRTPLMLFAEIIKLKRKQELTAQQKETFELLVQAHTIQRVLITEKMLTEFDISLQAEFHTAKIVNVIKADKIPNAVGSAAASAVATSTTAASSLPVNHPSPVGPSFTPAVSAAAAPAAVGSPTTPLVEIVKGGPGPAEGDITEPSGPNPLSVPGSAVVSLQPIR
jgi:hypothetical protein